MEAVTRENQALSPYFDYFEGAAGEGRKCRRKKQLLLSRDCCSSIWPELPWAVSKTECVMREREDC